MTLFDLCCSRGTDNWKQAVQAEGIVYIGCSAEQLNTPKKRQEISCEMADACHQDKVVVLFSNHGMDKELEDYFSSLSGDMILLPVGADAIALNRGNAGAEHLARINEYIFYGGETNLQSAIRYLRKYLFLDCTAEEPPLPEKLPFDGIYSLTSEKVYTEPSQFLQAEGGNYPVYVGILSHRSSWMNHTLQAERAIARALQQRSIGVIPVFSSGEKNDTVGSRDFQGVLEHYYMCNGKLLVDGIISLQIHLIKAQNGMSMFEYGAQLFRQLDIPIFHPLNSYSVTPEKWNESDNPLAAEMQSAYLNPEMLGMIEPSLTSLRDAKGGQVVCLAENIDNFADRVQRWLSLRKKPNAEKRLAIFLHNSVCSGVEATIGKAFGLDVLESVVRTLRRLKTEGYTVDDIPKDGRDLLSRIIEKRAYSDFRWTSVEDIVNSGGCLYRMKVQGEYDAYFQEFSPEMRESMAKNWGDPPGEGMVLNHELIITGIRFGNVAVMVQPKRGCYGSKCTGEVCRILHDPLCPPTHQYIATYRYVERIMKADAVIHFGTDGSLEYLPGKSSGLGQSCWPRAVLGSLPNLYPYHTGVPSEGTIAKRRASAVLIGYYPPSSSGFGEDHLALMNVINQYCEAAQMENGQEVSLRNQLLLLLSSHPNLMTLLESTENFLEGVQMVRASLLRCAGGRKISKLHVFGDNPDHNECVNYLCEMLEADGILERAEGEDEFDHYQKAHDFIEEHLKDTSQTDPVSRDLRQVYQKLQCTYEEEDSLIRALRGGYIAPGEAGMPDENGRKILPTGHNFYMMNMDKIPSQTAYARGIQLAEQLLEAYQRDEGTYPKKIGMNMISVDIARTHGEQLSQFLYLLGVRPVWDSRGRVIRLEIIPVSELGRPRIDITLRISGVMRDTWPDAVCLMDEAVQMVSSLQETEEENYLLANIRQMEQECTGMGQREKTMRIFGDPPGAFGAGIDLALKASAWQDERDLARYFIQSSAYAYGKNLNGRKSIREFIQNAKRVDLSCDVTSSRRADTLSCGFGLQVQGGFRMIVKSLGGKDIQQYQSTSELNTPVKTSTLAQQTESDIHETLLNEAWRDHEMQNGYEGAASIMKRIQNVFAGKCVNDCVKDETLDHLANAYINDPVMRQWLLGNNAYAAEEIARRLLELESRGRWKPDEKVLEQLREHYLLIEGCMEGIASENGEIQGGSVEIIPDSQVANWSRNLQEIDAYLKEIEQRDTAEARHD